MVRDWKLVPPKLRKLSWNSLINDFVELSPVFVQKNSGSDLKEVIEAEFGPRPIVIPPGTYIPPEKITITGAGMASGTLVGMNANTVIKAPDGLNDDIIHVFDCNDVDIDGFRMDGNKAHQTSGSCLKIEKVRRSMFGKTFLRTDYAKQYGIWHNGTGDYPDSNAKNLFGNIFGYYCEEAAFWEGGYCGETEIDYIYAQENVGRGIILGGSDGKVGYAHAFNNGGTGLAGHGIEINGHDYDILMAVAENNRRHGIRVYHQSGGEGYDIHFGSIRAWNNGKVLANSKSGVLLENVLRTIVDNMRAWDTEGANATQKYGLEESGADYTKVRVLSGYGNKTALKSALGANSEVSIEIGA